MAFFSGLFAAAGRDLFQRRCRVCGGLVPRCPKRRGASPSDWPPALLCAACAEALAPRRGGFCPGCGAIGPDPRAEPALCPACAQSPRPFASLAFHAPYQGLLRDMILSFKFGKQPEHAGVLRELLTGALTRAARGPATADVIVPIPLHPARLAWRGFNQSLELARGVSRTIGRPIDARALVRVRDTRPQSTLSGRERRENIQGAFLADPARVSGRVALLADDVMTTGATMDAASQALLDAGAARVDVVVLAR